MALIVSEINGEIRFLLGSLPTSILSDDILNKIIQRNIDKYGSEDDKACIVTYKSLLDALQYLINESAQGSGSISGGALTERTEQVGKKKITVKYSPDASGAPTGWEELYEKFLADPTLVCDSLVNPPTSSALGSVIIGGVSNKEYDRVKSDPDNRSGYSMGYSGCITKERSRWR